MVVSGALEYSHVFPGAYVVGSGCAVMDSNATGSGAFRRMSRFVNLPLTYRPQNTKAEQPN